MSHAPHRSAARKSAVRKTAVRKTAVRRVVAAGAVIGAIGGLLCSAPAALATGTGRITGNWAGYEQKPPSGVVYTAVRATFVVPTVAVGTPCSGSDPCAKSSTWAGIGGDPNPLVQTGTEADLHPDGTATYWAWAEIVPDSPNHQRVFSLTVRPGDGITATVTETAANTWVMTIKDLTTGKHASRTVTNYAVPAASSSAEVIHERTGNAPLTPTTDVVFDHAQYATSAPGTSPAWQPFFQMPAGATLYDEQMCSQSGSTSTCPPPAQIVATPSNADTDQDGFAITDGATPPVPPTSAGGVITAVTDPTIFDPVGITAGPDGAMWYANESGSSIGRIAPDGTVASYTSPQMSSPVAITAGPDGALWFTDYGVIGRITTSGSITVYGDSRIYQTPYAITAGPDGALWFTDWDPTANKWAIGRVTTSGSFSFYYDPSLNNPYGITAGRDGALWFANQGDCSSSNSCPGASIGRITTTGVISSYTNASIQHPTGITAGPDGALWYINEGDACTSTCTASIGRITTSGLVSSYPARAGFYGYPAGITTGPDGALWFTDFSRRATIGRITVSGKITYYHSSAYNDSGMWPLPAIAAGPDGRLWFTSWGINSNIVSQITTP